MDQVAKGEAFRRLHDGPGMFVIPNPWDAGSAKVLAALGFKAMTTTSAGLAWAIGKADGKVTRAESLANAAAVVSAVDLPVAADLENGFGHRPRDAAETVRQAAAIGLVGGSIEDFSGDESNPIYAFSQAVERVAAAAEAAHALPFPFTFVARTECLLHGISNLDETIRRLQAFEEAGADVLFAPGLPDIEAVRIVCRSVSKPVNVVNSAPKFSLAELEAAGVRRVSVGGLFSRVALTALKHAAEEMLDAGTFGFGHGVLSTAEVNDLMER